MAAEWIISMKDGFIAQWLALPSRENHQVQEKVRLLADNPLPDAKVKKQLKHIDPRLHRIRSGDYRIFYTFDKPYVSLLELSKRDEDTYEHAPAVQTLGGLAGEMPDPPAKPAAPAPNKSPQKPASRALPARLQTDLLARLKVPSEFHVSLCEVRTEDDLLACAGVPDDLLLRIHQAMFERPFEELFQQREHVAPHVDDLLRYKEGELLGFLLRLTPEQEKFVAWALNAGGPTLVKGGPGTGKSTVALYRVRAMLATLKKNGETAPRILFTTYTNALVAFSRQLLDSLLGADAGLVEVRTADSLARDIVQAAGRLLALASPPDLRELAQEAMASARFEGSSLERRTQTQALQRLGTDYLLDEINHVIDARGLQDLAAYLGAARPGRGVALNASQRGAVWAASEIFHEKLARRRQMTWQQLRAVASVVVAEGRGPAKFDAVVVDEVQDLDPTAIRMLAALPKAPGGLFLTADANQSIFGSGFRWQDVHDSLRFRGRTGVLRTNHRSTREIGEAARCYLSGGQLEEAEPAAYSHAGPLPAMRAVRTTADETALLDRFVRTATKELHLAPSAATVFVPTERAGKRLATALAGAGLSAQFMTGRELDLSANAVKIMTLKSSKGLEFPVVALAGFGDGPYPYVPAGAQQEEIDERLAQERRTVYVAMTRAMRALLVVVPPGEPSPLLTGFDASNWNVGGH